MFDSIASDQEATIEGCASDKLSKKLVRQRRLEEQIFEPVSPLTVSESHGRAAKRRSSTQKLKSGDEETRSKKKKKLATRNEEGDYF